MIKTSVLVGALLLSSSVAAAQEKVYCVSNAHFDSQWNWTVQTSIDEYIPATIYRNLWLLDNYPDYVINFEGGVKYSWMKEYYPEAFERVRDYVRKGRWHVSGASWDANDTNVPSPESQLRNILLGQQFYRSEFGVTSDDVFLPDCFGFSYTLPSVAAHAGLLGFSTQKLQWRNKPFYPGDRKVPFNVGLWKGVDGSVIMAALNCGDYTRRFGGEPLTDHSDVRDLVASSPNNAAYMYYGVGDRGGAPTIKSVMTVLSPGNTVEVIPATSSQMYHDYLPYSSHPELPVYDGELLMDLHGNGCYTSQAAMKTLNRKNEKLADAAERISVMAHYLTGHPYPAAELNTEWQRFIWHQFHDDLTGTSIPEAYVFSWNDELIAQNKFVDLIDAAASAASTLLDTRAKGVPVMVYNPVSASRKETVTATIPVDKTPRSVSVYGPDNRQVKAQIDRVADGKATVSFSAEVPAVSLSVFDVRFSSKAPAASSLKATENSIENSIYRVTLDSNGDIASIVDKRYDRELVDGAFRLAMFDKNESYWWPSWEIHKAVIDREPRGITGNVSTSVERDGEAAATLKVERTDGDSRFIQYITLHDGAADDRIDIENVIDWDSRATLLKAEFNTAVSAPVATYDLGLGRIERGNNTETAFEVPAQYWADLSDGDYGITFMTDSKYGWDKPRDNTLRLSLIHTPARGCNDFAHQETQDLGHHRFSYSIRGHKGNLDGGETVYAAENFNNPLIAYTVPKHKGEMGRSFSFLNVDAASSPVVKALKMAEDGDGYVVRLYQTSGNAADNSSVTFPAALTAASALTGTEEQKGSIATDGATLPVSLSRFGLATCGVRMPARSNNATGRQIKVALPMNHGAFTINEFRHEDTFTDDGHSFAAEIAPDSLVSAGIGFNLSRRPGEHHVVLCHNDTIALPEGHDCRYLYILATSRGEDVKTSFRVNGRDVEVSIPSFAGEYGQWGRKGFSENFLRDEPLAYVGTHTHSSADGDIPYKFNYIYRLKIDLPAGTREIVLPDNDKVAVFAMTLGNNDITTARRVSEPRYIPGL
ncbi:MAG: alpha-mannosidase [Duncaniella sp.]|nr:alpha-mannosidase [Duncaniella sp.]